MHKQALMISLPTRFLLDRTYDLEGDQNTHFHKIGANSSTKSTILNSVLSFSAHYWLNDFILHTDGQIMAKYNHFRSLTFEVKPLSYVYTYIIINDQQI